MPAVPVTETDGVALARLRSERGLSRRQLAAKAYCTPEYIGMLEIGRVNAATQMLREIARALDVNVSCLTYTGPLTLAERALTPAARRGALAVQEARETRLAIRQARDAQNMARRSAA